jgi:hypothetical protein
MPNVTATPRTMSDGSRITNFTDSVGSAYVTFTYAISQEKFTIHNRGIQPILYTVGSYTDITVNPGESSTQTVSLTSFQVKSQSGVQRFEVFTDETGDDFTDVAVEKLSNQIGNLSNKTNFIDVVADYGAVADYNTSTKTGTDNTAAFINAIAAAQSQGKYVRIPSGKYLIATGNIDILQGVSLIGDDSQSPFKVDYSHDKFNGINQHGVTIFTRAGLNDTTKFTFKFRGDNYVKNIEFFYPDQNDNTVPASTIPKTYGSTFATTYAVDNITLENVNIVNAWIGIDFSWASRFVLNKVSICAASIGMIVGQSVDVDYMDNVVFFPNHQSQSMRQYFAQNGTAIQITRADGIYMTNIFCYEAQTFIKTLASSTLPGGTTVTGSIWGGITNFTLDSVNVAFDLSAPISHSFKASKGYSISGNQWLTGAQTSPTIDVKCGGLGFLSFEDLDFYEGWAQTPYSVTRPDYIHLNGTCPTKLNINIRGGGTSRNVVVNYASTWTASTSYTVGQVIVPATRNDHIYQCTTAGTSGSSAPTFPTTSGGTVTDGTVVWTEIGLIANMIPVIEGCLLGSQRGAQSHIEVMPGLSLYSRNNTFQSADSAFKTNTGCFIYSNGDMVGQGVTNINDHYGGTLYFNGQSVTQSIFSNGSPDGIRITANNPVNIGFPAPFSQWYIGRATANADDIAYMSGGLAKRYIQYNASGTTANRPTGKQTGFMYFDTTLNKPVFFDGTNWRDSTGTIV